VYTGTFLSSLKTPASNLAGQRPSALRRTFDSGAHALPEGRPVDGRSTDYCTPSLSDVKKKLKENHYFWSRTSKFGG
jgi:hypothetical protein